MTDRIFEIKNEINLINTFGNSDGLTIYGKSLVNAILKDIKQ